MRQIDLTPFDMTVGVDEKGEPIVSPFDVQKSLANIIFHDGINAREAVIRTKLAEQIESCTEPFILVEEADYKKLVQAVERLSTVPRQHVPFVQRVFSAPVVKVKPAPSPVEGAEENGSAENGSAENGSTVKG